VQEETYRLTAAQRRRVVVGQAATEVRWGWVVATGGLQGEGFEEGGAPFRRSKGARCVTGSGEEGYRGDKVVMRERAMECRWLRRSREAEELGVGVTG
jgi:hypothetical protein